MKLFTTILVLVVSFNTAINAQNIKEAVQNSKQIIEGKKNLERDSKELAAYKLKINAFNNAFKIRNLSKSNELKASILTDMIREVQQSGVKAKKARLEIAQSSAEIRSDRREIRRDKEDSKKGRFDSKDDKKDLNRDKANMRDDKRDRRDDIRDFEDQIKRAERQATILKSLKGYRFSYSTERLGEAEVNKKLLHEFLQTLQADIIATKKELNEDIRESREDSRERRDDRNEKNEPDNKKKKRRG